MPRKKNDDFIVDDDLEIFDENDNLVTGKAKKAKKPADSSNEGKPKSNFFQFMNRAGPAALGSKEIPSGPPECLLGKTFVVTGIPQSITREDMEDLIKRHGGRVTSAVSGKTSYLVVGSDPGQTKLDKAKKLKTTQLDEDGLFDMIKSANGANGSSDVGSAPAPPKASTSVPKKEVKAAVKAEPTINLEEKLMIPPARNYKWMQPDAQSVAPAKVSDMWVDKYKPKSISEIVGNNSHVQDLIRFLKDFDPNQPYSSTVVRAVLITGPPGIGKTTAAHLACKETGYDALEFNASDVRNKAAIQSKIGTASSNHSITSFFGTGNKKPETKRLALILDEIDGMSGGDRGGVQEVIKMIKATKVPIICIANDRMNTKVRSLANHCKDMKFSRPTSASIKKRIEHIAAKENLFLSINVIDKLVSSTQNDIRQIINLLSTWKLSSDSLSYDEANTFSKDAQKNQTIGPFDITQRYFNGSFYASNTIQDRFDYYFNDFSIIPLMVQENYINSNPKKVSPSETPAQQQLKHLELLSLAADSISEGDLIDYTIYNQQQWSLMPVHSLYSCVAPSYYMHGGMNGMINFAGWLGKNSTANKNKRILQELYSHMQLKISGDKDQLCQQYLPTLLPMLVKPLATDQSGGIPEVIELMDEYYLTKEDWDNLIEFGGNDKIASTFFKNIPSTVKSAFTRTYNKMEHPTAFSTSANAKKSKTPASSQPKPDLDDIVDDDESPADEEVENESEEDELQDKLIKKVKKPVKRGSSSSTKSTNVKKPRKAKK